MTSPTHIASTLVVACLALALGLAGCKKVLNGNDKDDSFHVRMVNLVEDSPAVQYLVDGTVIASTGYLTRTELNAAHPGSHTVSFAIIRPASLNSSDSTDPIPMAGSFEQSYSQGRDYTVFAYGTLASPHAFTMDEQSGKAAVEDDFIEYQFVNASANAPSVDIYITAPEGQITSPQKLATVPFGQKTETTKLKLFKRADVTDTTAALFVDFIIELRDPTTGAVLFNSGKVRLTEKTRFLWAVANNNGPAPAPVRLMGLDGLTDPISDTNERASVRAVHLSADSSAFDIFADSSLSAPIATNLAFRDASAYLAVPKGEVDLFASPAGNTSVAILFLDEFVAASGTSYSAYAVGPQGSTDFTILTDDVRSVPTQSSFRFFSAAPSQSGQDALDVYVTLPGQSLDFNASTSTTSDDASGFFKGTIAYNGAPSAAVVLKSGTYQVRMMSTGTSRVVFDTEITVADGSVSTFVLLDDIETASLELVPVEQALTR